MHFFCTINLLSEYTLNINAQQTTMKKYNNHEFSYQLMIRPIFMERLLLQKGDKRSIYVSMNYE